MQTRRRQLFLGTCAATLLTAAPALAQGKYPSKPVKFVVPFAAGGGSDTVARAIAQKLNERFGYTIIVDNKPGAGGNLGAEIAMREPADGYTFLVVSGSYAGNAVVNKPAFDPIAAIEPVVQFTQEPSILCVGPATPFKSLQELVAEARKDPGRIAYGSAGTGSLGHLATEYLNSMLDIKMTHVPYKGTSAALIDLASGQIQVLLAGTTAVAALAKSGKVRPIAVSALSRLPSMPNLATLAELGQPHYRADLWHGLVAAKGVSPEIIDKLNAEINTVLRSPEILARFAQDDVSAGGGTPQQFGDVIRSDMERWRNVIKQSNIKFN